MSDIEIFYDSDESFEIRAKGVYVGSADHDRDGWSGMEHIREILQAVAKELYLDFTEKGDPNV